MGFDSNNNSMFSNHAGVRSMQMDSAPSYYNGKELASLAGEEADDEDEMTGGVYTGGSWKSISRSINRGARDLGGDIRRSANQTGRDIERSANATGRDINRSAMQTGRDFNRELIKPSAKAIRREANQVVKQANQAVKQAEREANQTARAIKAEANQTAKALEREANQTARAIKQEAKRQGNMAIRDLRATVRPGGFIGQAASYALDEIAPVLGQGFGAAAGSLVGNPALGSAFGEELASYGRDTLRTKTGYGAVLHRSYAKPQPHAGNALTRGGAKPKGKGGGARGALIRQVMASEGCSLPQASKLIKQRGLY